MAPTSLYDLPPEVRVRIFEYALVERRCSICPYGKPPTPRQARRRNDRFKPVRKLDSQVRAKRPPRNVLLQTCRLFRQEASTIFYGNNTFWVRKESNGINSVAALGMWLGALEDGDRKAVSEVWLSIEGFINAGSYWGEGLKSMRNEMKGFKGLVKHVKVCVRLPNGSSTVL